MRGLILCEGKTDAILLSYYLERTCGWTYTNMPPESLSIRAEKSNETINWYKREDDMLLICGVGGKNNFGSFFKRVIKNPLVMSNAFQKMVVMIDRDSSDIETIEEYIMSEIDCVKGKFTNQKWINCEYEDSYKVKKDLNFLLLIIPDGQQGALETVLLDSISENPYDKYIVDESKNFVLNIQPKADKYILSKRLQLKAELSVTWAIQSPDKAFDFIDEQIKKVKWENSTTLKSCFSELEKL